jgi:hypothetical protein
VRGSAGFHDHGRLPRLGEEDLELSPREASAELDPTRPLRHCELENGPKRLERVPLTDGASHGR